MRMNLFVIHGPNLNLLGTRLPDLYGAMTLPEINRRIRAYAAGRRARVRILQANCEGRIIDAIHRQRRWADWIILNPAAFTHYSYAIRDAIEACGVPAVEVHLTDIRKREPFRRKSVIAPVCRRQFMGFGWRSYIRAAQYCLDQK